MPSTTPKLSGRLITFFRGGPILSAVVAFQEPNGDIAYFYCRCYPDGSCEITGDPDTLEYMNVRYGERRFSYAVRSIMFGFRGLL